jgi:hypothetical protein
LPAHAPKALDTAKQQWHRIRERKRKTECGANDWAMTPSGMRGVLNDALSIHSLAADLSGHLVLGRDLVPRLLRQTGLLAKLDANGWISCALSRANDKSGWTPERGAGNPSNRPWHVDPPFRDNNSTGLALST